MMRRFAIIGGGGLLGTALREALAGRDVSAPPHRELAIEDRTALAAWLDDARPEVLVNCSAFHHVDTCEREPEAAFAVNALAVDRAAEACAARGIAFATISTDYVFDGEAGRAYHETDAPNPRTAYGVSKLAGELLVRRRGGEHFIVRTSGVFGAAGISAKGLPLIEKVLRQAEAGEPTRMVSDVVFSPSYAPDVARAIVELADRRAFGTHHVTNTGAASWYEFVRAAFDRCGYRAELQAVPYASLRNDVQRPLFSPLENTTFAGHGIAPMPGWEDALERFLARRTEAAAARSWEGSAS